jgi:hypothetical protein
MLLKSVFISVHAPFLQGCAHTICNKSSRGHAGHITGGRTAFQMGCTYKQCYYNYSMEYSCQPKICGYTNKYALRFLSNLGISEKQKELKYSCGNTMKPG